MEKDNLGSLDTARWLVFTAVTLVVLVDTSSSQSINVALSKNVSMSSTLEYPSGFFWVGSLAVDGETGPLPDDCQCCSGTDKNNNSLLTLDLGKTFTIYSVQVIGRSDRRNGKLEHLNMFLRNSTDWDDNPDYDHGSDQSQEINFTLLDVTIARYVTLVLRQLEFLVVCEIKVFKKDCIHGKYGSTCSLDCPDDCDGCDQTDGRCTNGCNTGRYGDDCNMNCPDNCKNNVCDQTQGHCTDRCVAGFQGTDCSTACSDNTYGENCELACGQCLQDVQCDTKNGTCLNGCDDGFTGGTCKDECTDGTFGANCSQSCGHCMGGDTKCNHVNGTCSDRCQAGFTGNLCKTECYNGQYGPNCIFGCGNCHSISECNKQNGTCMTGCIAGYQPGLCKDACNNQTFGVNCSRRCHCADGKQCNATTGYCPNETCSIGYGGHDCTLDLNLIPKIRTNITTDMSSTYIGNGFAWSSNLSVDGNIGPDAETCRCCSATTTQPHTQYHWWRLDLQQLYLVEYITVHARKGKDLQIKGFEVYIGNSTNVTGPAIYMNSATNTNLTYTIPVTPARPTQTVEIRKPTHDNVLTLCEVKVLEKFCDVDRFGYNCSSRCYCRGNMPCNSVTGRCESGCREGWTGSACNEECGRGTFGENCVSECRCTDVTSCSRFDGKCENSTCLPGWQGDNCYTACDDGKYGQNCSFDCGECTIKPCSKVNGTCVGGCTEGYNEPLCAEPIGQGPPPTVGIAVGSVVGVVVIALIIGVVIFWRRRHSRDRSVRRELSPKTEKSSDTGSHMSNTLEDGNACTYDNLTMIKPMGIQVHNLYDHILRNLENDAEGLVAEYSGLQSGLIEEKATVAFLPENKAKNRYRGMVAYDHSRVCLKDVGPGQSDYINACYINGFEKVKKFIASQGPTPAMINDFWSMVWQEQSGKIVMLTNLVEVGGMKCIQYWPDQGTEVYGDISVTLIKTQSFTDYCIRSLDIRKDNSTCRRIEQFHYLAWPDKNVPDSAWSLVQFWKAVNARESILIGPCVVHCSAGVGRTGTFIGLDCLYNMAKIEGSVNVFSCVESLRAQRVNMVQTKGQYIYLHEALAESLNFGTMSLLTGQYREWYMKTLESDKQSNKCPLEIQYEMYIQSLGEYENGIAMANGLYRRKPGHSMPCHILQNYLSAKAYVVTDSPRKDTVGDFWQIVDKHNVETILSLIDKHSSTFKFASDLGAKEIGRVKSFMVRKESTTELPSCIEQTFKYNTAEQMHEKTVRQFHFLLWDRDDVPTSTNHLLTCLGNVEKWQPQQSEHKPILLVSDRPQRSALICLILNEMQRIKMDGAVNILRSAKTMKSTDDEMTVTPGFMQFKFCYDVILEHLNNSDVYQNVPR